MITNRRRCMASMLSSDGTINPDMGITSKDIDIIKWDDDAYCLPFEYDAYYTDNVYDVPLCKLSSGINNRFNNANILNMSVSANLQSSYLDGDMSATSTGTIKSIYFRDDGDGLYIYGKILCNCELKSDGNFTLKPNISNAYAFGWSLMWNEPRLFELSPILCNFTNLSITQNDIIKLENTQYSASVTWMNKTHYSTFKHVKDETNESVIEMEEQRILLTSNINSVVYVESVYITSSDISRNTQNTMNWTIEKNDTGWYIIFNCVGYIYAYPFDHPMIKFDINYGIIYKL